MMARRHLGHLLPSAFMEPLIQISQKRWPHLVIIILCPSCFLDENAVKQIVHFGPLGLGGAGGGDGCMVIGGDVEDGC